MPFCAACGKENVPGQNFCEFCGASLKHPKSSHPAQASQPPSPVQPAGVPPPPPPVVAPPGIPAGPKLPLPKNAVIGIAAAVVVLIVIAYIFGLPLINKPGSGTDKVTAGTQTPVITPEPQPSTIAPTSVVTSVPTPAPTLMGMSDPRYEEDYDVVYSKVQKFKNGDKVDFPYALTNPPLFIKYNLTPTMTNRSMLVDIGRSSERKVYSIRPAENAWFEIQVLDGSGGAVVDKRGFGTNKGYTITTKDEFMVRETGTYIVRMSGHEVTADVVVLTGNS